MRVRKSKQRLKIESLSRQEMISLMTNNSLREIAENYNTSTTTVNKIYNELISGRDIGELLKKNNFISEDDLIVTNGAWMKSKERLYLKTIKNKINYE